MPLKVLGNTKREGVIYNEKLNGNGGSLCHRGMGNYVRGKGELMSGRWGDFMSATDCILGTWRERSVGATERGKEEMRSV